MVPIKNLKPGMKIKIVDHWVPGCCENPDGLMDHWLGQIVTVRRALFGSARIEEDQMEHSGGGWSWFSEAIDYIVADDEQLSDMEFPPASDEVFQSLFSQPSGGEVSHG